MEWFHEIWNSIDRLARIITLANWGIAASLLLGFFFTVIVIKAGNRKDDLAAIEESKTTAKITTLGHDTEELKKGNLQLGIDLANAQGEMAKQEARAAEAEKSLLELQQRLAHRRIGKTEQDKIAAALKPFRGSTVQVTKLGDAEAAQFADDLLAIFNNAGWEVKLRAIGTFSPPKYGLDCLVDESTLAGQALGAALRKIPGAEVRSVTLPAPNTAVIFVGLKPPA
jgi:hypothetical protein